MKWVFIVGVFILWVAIRICAPDIAMLLGSFGVGYAIGDLAEEWFGQ